MASTEQDVFVVSNNEIKTLKLVDKEKRYYFPNETKNEIIPLMVGYSDLSSKDYTFANCSSTLIKTPNNVNIIVDTATAWDSETIISELKKHHLTPDDITYVVCTHGHADHVGCNFLFTNARFHFIGTCGHHHNKFLDIDFKIADYDLVDGVRLIHTPGHTPECISVIVKGKFVGEENVIVAITGDLFENKIDWSDYDIWMCCGTPEFKLKQAASRADVINHVTFVIPGHDEYFAVMESHKLLINNQYNDFKERAS